MSDDVSVNDASATHVRRPHLGFRIFRALAATALLLVAGGYTLAAVVLWSEQDAIIFARAEGRSSGRELPPTGERIWYTASDGRKIEAWYFKGVGRSAESTGPLLVCFHGNADFIENWSWMAETCQKEGFNVLLPEFRGYGRSEGEPSEKAIVADSVGIIREALKRPEVEKSKLILLGRSLGGGVACGVAAELQPAALVLECTFTSVASMAGRYWMPQWLVRHPFHNDEVLPKIKSPVMIVHGTHDRVISISHAETLKKVRPDAEFMPLDCDHNDLPGKDEGKYRAAFEAFLRARGLWPRK